MCVRVHGRPQKKMRGVVGGGGGILNSTFEV